MNRDEHDEKSSAIFRRVGGDSNIAAPVGLFKSGSDHFDVVYLSSSSYYLVRQGKIVSPNQVRELIRNLEHFYDQIALDEINHLNQRLITCVSCGQEMTENHFYAKPEIVMAQYWKPYCKNCTYHTKIDFKSRRSDPGYVYLAWLNGLHKIGKSKSPTRRMKEIGKANLIHQVYAQDTGHVERQLHCMFYHRHVEGEWFDLTLGDVEYIKGLQVEIN